MTKRTSLLLCLLLGQAAACGGPFLVFPGGSLSGEVASAPPGGWPALESGVFAVETRPGDPYSVNIWAVGLVFSISRYRLLKLTPRTAANAIAAYMSDALVLLDPEGRVTKINRATAQLLGYALAELRGRPLDMLFPEMEIEGCELFRVTRNANTEKNEEHADDLLSMIESELQDRKFAPIVRLETAPGMDPTHRGRLAAELESI